MGIQNFSALIKEARHKANLTQEQMCDGICDVYTLYRIENNLVGVSPALFHALMERVGSFCEILPIFSSREDFECFRSLNKAKLYLESWQLTHAYEHLHTIENFQWANNKLYYQFWLLLLCDFHRKANSTMHDIILDNLTEALHISRNSFDIQHLNHFLLTEVEIQIIIFSAREYLALGNEQLCNHICTEINNYLYNTNLSYFEKNKLLVHNNIVLAECMMKKGQFHEIISLLEPLRKQTLLNREFFLLSEITYWESLAHFHLGNIETSLTQIKNLFLASHSVNSPFANICKSTLYNISSQPLAEYIEQLPPIDLPDFSVEFVHTPSTLQDGVYDLFSQETFTIGKIIQHLRQKHSLSQPVLCRGLCSVSKLSKIENGSLQPDIFLAEALLQRLGVSERIFSFYGNCNESKINDLKFQLIHGFQHRNAQANELLLKEIEKLNNSQNILINQFILLNKALLHSGESDRLDILMQALEMSQPNLDLFADDLSSLSWCEFNILNCIANTLHSVNKRTESIQILNKLLAYHKHAANDTLLNASLLSFSLYYLCRFLYDEKQYTDILQLNTGTYRDVLYLKPYVYSFFLFYYTQALCECGKISEATTMAHYTCALQDLMDMGKNSQILRNGLRDFYSITLD